MKFLRQHCSELLLKFRLSQNICTYRLTDAYMYYINQRRHLHVHFWTAASEREISSKIMTSDETWISYIIVKSKQKSMQWHRSNSPKVRKFRFHLHNILWNNILTSKSVLFVDSWSVEQQWHSRCIVKYFLNLDMPFRIANMEYYQGIVMRMRAHTLQTTLSRWFRVPNRKCWITLLIAMALHLLIITFSSPSKSICISTIHRNWEVESSSAGLDWLNFPVVEFCTRDIQKLVTW